MNLLQAFIQKFLLNKAHKILGSESPMVVFIKIVTGFTHFNVSVMYQMT
jgi:hypothetical protein